MTHIQITLHLVAVLAGRSLLVGLALLFRKPKTEAPAELTAAIAGLEQNILGIVSAHGRLEGVSIGLDRKIQTCTEEMSSGFAASRKVLDEQLGRMLNESRNWRVELQAAFQKFEEWRERRISGFELALSRKLVVLAEVAPEAAFAAAERLRLAVQALAIQHKASGAAPVLTVTVGVASGVPGCTIQQLMNAAAEQAMAAKMSRARNQVHPIRLDRISTSDISVVTRTM